MANVSAFSFAIQLMQIGLGRPSVTEVREHTGIFWRLGQWILMSHIVNLLSSQFIPWAIAYFHGIGVAGALRAIMNLLGATHPILYSVGSLIITLTAKIHKKDGLAAAQNVATRLAAQGALLILPFYIALFAFAEPILELVYGQGTPYLDFKAALQLASVGYCITFLAQMLQAFLNGLGDSRSSFFTDTVGALSALIVGLPLAIWTGVVGATISLSIVSSVRVIACLIKVRQHQHSQNDG
jgi:O-antigen/teichoic acid export membrane protein